jgi:glucose-1-phosphate thymidylyltransferase
MKAIIPVAGAGTHLRPFTYTQPKALIPVAGKPIIKYIIDDLCNNGITEFIFIVGYLGDKIIDYIQNNYSNLTCHFVFQAQREGLGQAIFLAKEYINIDDEIVIYLGDSIIDIPSDFFGPHNASLIATKKVQDPQNFGLIEMDDTGKITHFIEKPKFPTNNLAMVGLYKIKETEKLFEILEKLNKDNIRTNGEIQLTDALQIMAKNGVIFNNYEATNWMDVGKWEILLQTNAILLKKYGNSICPTAIISNSVIIEPVSIADNAQIINSIVGPNVTIGSHTKIEDSIISEGIIGDFSKLNTIQLTQFVIGSDSSLKGSLKSLTVGDNTEIDFSFK